MLHLSESSVVDHLILASYTSNRKRNPEIKPHRWEKLFGEDEGKLLESAFQRLTSTKHNVY
jgi:hypothetical protein